MGTCVREYDHRFPNRLIGRAVWSFCPKNFTDESTKQKCQGDDEDENGLNPVPVYDKYSNVTYKIFSAPGAMKHCTQHSGKSVSRVLSGSMFPTSV